MAPWPASGYGVSPLLLPTISSMLQNRHLRDLQTRKINMHVGGLDIHGIRGVGHRRADFPWLGGNRSCSAVKASGIALQAFSCIRHQSRFQCTLVMSVSFCCLPMYRRYSVVVEPTPLLHRRLRGSARRVANLVSLTLEPRRDICLQYRLTSP